MSGTLLLTSADPATADLVTALHDARFDNYPSGNYARGFRLGLTADQVARGEISYAEAVTIARRLGVDV